MSMDPGTAARTADMLERHLTRVADGTWSPLQFVDAMSDFVSELRTTASATNAEAPKLRGSARVLTIMQTGLDGATVDALVTAGWVWSNTTRDWTAPDRAF